MHYAFPYGIGLECLADWNRLRERRGAAVHLLDGLFELAGFNFGHICRISWADGGGHAAGRLFPAT